ncbi:MAG: hypothetical protein CBC35_06080 [Planctomycetes bacterium TMED75]|nr:hypothetical protein [Planctomycetaceae bacterium]OUU93184.1 MAG: hypothetical protein CBC35_06080 [Planctomycetes bacterium TMED75]
MNVHRLPRLVLLLVLAGWVRVGSADTGQLREVVQMNGLNVVIFTAPTPLRAGEVEVVTLVTVEATGRPVLDYQLDVRVRSKQWDTEALSLLSMGVPDPGTRFAKKATVLLATPGEWELSVEIQAPEFDPVTVVVEVAVGNPHPLWWQLLPWLLAAVPCLGLILARDAITQRSRRRFPAS